MGAEHVVSNRFRRIFFHHGDVLVSRGVINRFDRKSLANRLQPFLVQDRSENRRDEIAVRDHVRLHLPGQLGEFIFDQVQAVFAALVEYQRPGPDPDDLAAQFRADAAAGTGYHDHPVLDIGVQQFQVRFDRVAAEQIAHADFAQVFDLDLAAGQIVHARQRGYMHGVGLEPGNNLAALRSRHRRHREDDLAYSEVLDHAAQLREAVDAQAVDIIVLQGTTVVDKRNRFSLRLPVSHHRARARVPPISNRVTRQLISNTDRGTPGIPLSKTATPQTMV